MKVLAVLCAALLAFAGAGVEGARHHSLKHIARAHAAPAVNATQVEAPAGGNTVEFVNKDGTSRTIIFTPGSGHAGIGSLHVGGNGRATASFPGGWQGNFYSVSAGAANHPGMLGELQFQGYAGATYFDVSAIVNPNDKSGVHMLYPTSGQPTSGCSTFPCGNAYYHPNDVQTKSTHETNFICTLGHNGVYEEEAAEEAEEAQVDAPLSANTVQFINKDGTQRTIIFTAGSGHQGIGSVTIGGGGQTTVTFPQGWQGNWYSVSQGASNSPGMLGEVAFQGYAGATYFDVSAIVNPNDMNGVHMLYPTSGQPNSGCTTFPCGNAYYHPNDVQTKSTPSNNLICTLGHNGVGDMVLPHSVLEQQQ